MSKRTVKKWGQKIKRGESLNPKIGRPVSGVLGSFDVSIRDQIDAYRPNAAGWGGVTIKTELEMEKKLARKKSQV